LLDDLIARAARMSVIRLPGVQSEMELAYGALHGLWSQLAEEDVERLPGPSGPRSGSRSALRLGPTESVLVGLAMLSGLADLAERQPLLVEGVGMVFAVRESIEPLRGLPELLIPAWMAMRPRRARVRVKGCG
jgi:hypothetical protein